MAYRLRPYVGDVREQSFRSEALAHYAVRERWPDAVGALNTSEDDHDLYVIVWRDSAAQARYDAPVALIAKDPRDPMFDVSIWRAEVAT